MLQCRGVVQSPSQPSRRSSYGDGLFVMLKVTTSVLQFRELFEVPVYFFENHHSGVHVLQFREVV